MTTNEQQQEKSTGVARRDFLKGAAAGAISFGAMGALFGCAPQSATAELSETGNAASASQTASDLTGWAGTPENILSIGGSTMPLADLNRMREEYVNAQTEFVCEDGTVIPEAYVKMRALIHTYGQGSGNICDAFSFQGITTLLTEEQAQAYIEMPYGVRFNAMDFQAKSGRPLEECSQLCEEIAKIGYLERYETADGIKYHQIGYFQGTEEYPFNSVIYNEDHEWLPGHMGVDHVEDFGSSGTPNFYTVPCGTDVLAEGETLPLHDDIEKLIRGKGKYAVAPCLCRWLWVRDNNPEVEQPMFDEFLKGDLSEYVSPVIGHRVETCLQTGDEAEYWLHQNMAREITEEEAVSILKRAVEDGFMIHSLFHEDHGTICCCHEDAHCLIIDSFTAIGEENQDWGQKPAFQQISHYMLDVDYDKCVKCGTCVNRCPLQAITMDGEGGTPKVSSRCERCGQCAKVCPQDARKLSRRPEEMNLPLPATHLDDYNLKGAYRFEKGLIK